MLIIFFFLFCLFKYSFFCLVGLLLDLFSKYNLFLNFAALSVSQTFPAPKEVYILTKYIKICVLNLASWFSQTLLSHKIHIIQQLARKLLHALSLSGQQNKDSPESSLLFRKRRRKKRFKLKGYLILFLNGYLKR